jgi:hypothetical protein
MTLLNRQPFCRRSGAGRSAAALLLAGALLAGCATPGGSGAVHSGVPR